MNNNLGTMEVSPDIIKKAKVGLWAFELDEGSAPRMYVDEVMLHLIGLEEQVSPEDTYYAWYNYIDSDHYDEVHEAVERMKAGIHAEVQYPWHNPNGQTSFVRCGGVRNYAYKKGIRIEGCHQDVTSVLHFEKEEFEEIHRERERYRLIHKTINSEMWFFYIDENDNIYKTVYSDDFYKQIGYDSPEEFSSDFDAWVELLHPDDKEATLLALRKAIADHTCSTPYDVEYRMRNKYGEYNWFHSAGRIVRDEYTGKAEFFGVHINITSEHESKDIENIISTLMKGYACVVRLNMQTENLKLVSFAAEKYAQYFPGWEYYQDLSESIQMIYGVVHPDDKDDFLKCTAKEHVIEELSKNETYTVNFRFVFDGIEEYWQMEYVKLDTTTPQIVLGFHSIDDIVRREKDNQDKRKLDMDIIDTFASDYSSVYYVNLLTEELEIYSVRGNSEYYLQEIYKEGTSYSETFRNFVAQFVAPEDRDRMLMEGSIPNIMKRLKDSKSYVTTYKNYMGHFCEMRLVNIDNHNDVPKGVALGFTNKDEIIRKTAESDKIAKRNIDIINALTSQYDSVYYINLTTDKIDTYEVDKLHINSDMDDFFKSDKGFSESYKKYVESRVLKSDRKKMLAAGSVYSIVKELENKRTYATRYRTEIDGEIRFYEMTFVKVKDDLQQTVVLTFADRNKDIKAEIESKEMQVRNMSVIKGLAGDFACVLYVDWNTNISYQYRAGVAFEEVIPGWAQMNDFRDCMTLFAQKIVHPDDREMFLEKTKKQVVLTNLSGNESYSVNFRVILNEKTLYYQIKFVRDAISGHHFICGFHDIDSEIRHEVEALEKAELASKSKTTFLFNMSHDIRTPMNAIMGYTSMAYKYSHDAERLSDYLDKITISGKQLLSLINQVLEMSRIETGNAQIQEEYMDVVKRTDLIFTIAEADIVKNNITVVTDTSKVKHRHVLTDKTKIGQIAFNVFGNAVKYTKEGGKISYIVEEEAYHKPGYGMYYTTVIDNGIGMSEEYLQHIYEAFSRENNSTVSKIQGTGLGMSIVKNLVDLLDGTIEIKSEKGKGTSVRIGIPMKWTTAVAEDDSVENIITTAGLKVLVVEDNEMNREIAVDMLEDCGAKVIEAEDGDVAVSIVENSKPSDIDIIFMDVQMPRMNGYDATRKIRALENNELSQIPIIAMTANAFEEDKRNAIEAGMNEHMAKPINRETIVATLANLEEIINRG